jgi:hypothetical protein
MRLSRQQVIEAMRDEIPKLTLAWVIEIDGRRFPVSQVWMCATGLSPKAFPAAKAARVLTQLGFEPFEVRQPLPRALPLGGTVSGTATARTAQVRLEQRRTALLAAAQFLCGQPDCEVEDVLALAEQFEAWLTRQ